MRVKDRDTIIITSVTVAFLLFVLLGSFFQMPLMGEMTLIGEFIAILSIINIYLNYTKN